MDALTDTVSSTFVVLILIDGLRIFDLVLSMDLCYTVYVPVFRH